MAMNKEKLFALSASMHLWHYLAETGDCKEDYEHYYDMCIVDVISDCMLCFLYTYDSPAGRRCTHKRYGRCPLISRYYSYHPEKTNCMYHICGRGAYAEWAEAGNIEDYAARKAAARKILTYIEEALHGVKAMSEAECIVYAQAYVLKEVEKRNERKTLSL